MPASISVDDFNELRVYQIKEIRGFERVRFSFSFVGL